MTGPIAVDTSVAIPLVIDSHDAHRTVTRWRGGRAIALCGHVQAETYSVLTRLPGALRVAPADAARVLATGFAPTVLLSAATSRRLPTLLAEAGIAGGAVYDALVALAARDHGRTLATRDARAVATYEALGVTVEVVG